MCLSARVALFRWILWPAQTRPSVRNPTVAGLRLRTAPSHGTRLNSASRTEAADRELSKSSTGPPRSIDDIHSDRRSAVRVSNRLLRYITDCS
jgi:hypothetical protein